MNKNKQKINYLKEFFNNNLLREFRLITENKKYNKSKFIEYKTNENLFLTGINKFIQEPYNKHKYNVFTHIYPFKDWDNLKKYRIQKKGKKRKLFDYSNDKPVRTYDRLFFDFDFDTNPVAKELKQKINGSIIKNDYHQKKEYMKQYHELLLNNGLAKKPLEDLRILKQYLDKLGIKSYPLFSGSKGFHLYIFFKPRLFNPDGFNMVAYSLFEQLRDNLKLETIDEAVFNNPSERISRPPYFKHNTTELFTYPIDINESYTTIIEQSFKPKIKPLEIATYTENPGNIKFSDNIKESIIIEIKEQEIKRKEQEKEKELNLKILSNKKTAMKKQGREFKEVERNCIRIANELMGSPEGDYGSYVTYICRWHTDHKPRQRRAF